MRLRLIAAFLCVAAVGGAMLVASVPAAAATLPTTVTLPVVPAAVGVPSPMTATVAPSGSGGTVPITGTVTFEAGGTPITGCTNIAVSPTSGLAATAECDITYQSTGTYSIVATYSGDANWTSSQSSTTTEKVLEPATVTASAPATAQLNQAVLLSTTVSGSGATPTGTVDFDNSSGNLLCSATLSGGKGSCDATFTVGGAQTAKADYQGNATYANSTGSNSFGTATIDVALPATTTSLSAQEVALPPADVPSGTTASAMNFTATVTASGTPGTNLGGSVTFSVNGHAIAQPGCSNAAVSGASPQSVTCSDSNPEEFGGPVVATYSGDPHYADSASPAVSPSFTPDSTRIASVTALPASPTLGQSLTLSAGVTAYVNPAQGPVGFVAFTSGALRLCIAEVNSSFVGTCQTSALPSGVSTVTATYADPSGGYASSSSSPFTVTVGPSLYPVVGMAAMPDGGGYWVVRSDGAVSAFGDAVDFGSMFGQPLNKPIVGIAATPDGGGYWLVATDGGIFSFGDAQFYGSTGSITLNRPIVGMTSTPDGKGYYFVASDGGVFAYGDARFQGSMGGTPLNQPVVGMALDPATGGYWLVAADGGIFSFGGAPFLGSTGSIHLNQAIVGMEAAPDGSGYRFVASDGGVFCYGLPFEGSTGSLTLNQPVVGMAPGGNAGYWLVARDGGLFSFDAPFLGAATY